MSDPGGYEPEMLRRRVLDDETCEAILTGRSPVPEELAGLVLFAEDARALSRGRVLVPGSELQAMFVDGVSAENGDLLVTAASNVHGPAQQVAGLPKRRNKKMTVAGLLAGLSLGAKAALGIGVAAASVTGAAAAGVLPDAAQHAVSSTVNSVSPFEFPDSANDHADFGKKVSDDATGRDNSAPGVDGKTISGDAAQNGLDTANNTPAAGHVPTSVPSGASSTPAADNVPTSVPSGASSTPAADNVPTLVPPTGSVPGSESSAGTDTASNTPADGHVPTPVPPSGRP